VAYPPAQADGKVRGIEHWAQLGCGGVGFKGGSDAGMAECGFAWKERSGPADDCVIGGMT